MALPALCMQGIRVVCLDAGAAVTLDLNCPKDWLVKILLSRGAQAAQTSAALTQQQLYQLVLQPGQSACYHGRPFFMGLAC